MMNDRFSAQLRQHLLDTANERPAHGQLAALDGRVAQTSQHSAFVARLTWFPVRTGLFPSATMRYALIAAALVIATVAAALFAAGGGPSRSTVFEGAWTSIDRGDGSTMNLIVGAGSSPSVHFEDLFATGVACVADEVKVFTMDGIGAIVGERLFVEWPDGGGCGLVTIDIGPGAYTYDEATDSITDGDALAWTRVEASVVPPSGTPTTAPSPTTDPSPYTMPSASLSGLPTPHPGEATFTSAFHGFSMGVPPGWQTRPAAQPWGGEPLDFDSPAADVIFDPTHGDGLYLLVASRSFSQLSEDEWSGEVLAWTCPEGRGEFWSWRVDGFYSSQRGPCNSGSIIAADTRGYLIRLVASTDTPEHALVFDWDWVKLVLETVDLRPEDAIDPPAAGTPVPRCADLAPGDTYTNRFGAPRLSATVPVGAESSWQGYRDAFELGSGSCPFGRPVRIDVSTVDAVIDNACEPWTRSPLPFGTVAEAADAIVAQPGHRTSEPTEVTIAGHAALRLEISAEGSSCTDGIGLWANNEFSIDQDAIVYLVDLDGNTLAIGVWYERSQTTPAQRADAEAIVASIQVAP
jgi:hypothetical protein